MPHKPFHRANVKKTENIKTKMGQKRRLKTLSKKRRSALKINRGDGSLKGDKKY